ncbi:MAG: hypothetical protein GF309_10325 [Candidatus Lokiarchaeota archaeon]|nr:hypothetical protein [Candidatus Lokiarchaeota archaeon]
MRICQNCGKANQVTRKYCIRCGKRLVAPSKPSSSKPSPPEPQPARQEVAASEPEVEEAASEPTPEESTPSSSTVTSGDEWVRPSEVARNRVRRGKSVRKSELEKAQDAFARGDQALVDDDRPGIVETRMLRASEVHELMKEPQEISQPEPQPMPPSEPPAESQVDTPAETTAQATTKPPTPPQPEQKPSRSSHEEEIERRILGSESAFVKKEEEAAQAEEISAQELEEPEPVPRKISSEFQSSRYTQEDAEVAAQSIDAQELDSIPLDETGEFEPQAPPSQREISDVEGEYVATCPECGNVFGVDRFTYPDTVYSEMGEARLKQARFFVVQGKDGKAQEILRIARSLFEKADDEDGLKQVNKLVDSLVDLA